MKKNIRLIIVISLLSLLSGCAYYSKMAVPGEPAQQGKYEIIEHIKTSITGVRFLTIPINVPSSAQIIKDEVTRLGGDGIINVETTFSEFNFIVLSFPIVEVEGDVVKIAGQSTYTSKSTSEGAKAHSVEIADTLKLQNVHVDPVEFQKWKEKLLSYIKKSDYYWSWKSFEKRYSLKISREQWVNSLPEVEYVRYLNSKKSVDKWLEDRLKE